MGIDRGMKSTTQQPAHCTLAGVADLAEGPVLCLFNHYAYHANGSTIHSKIQLMDNGNLVDDCPIKLGGTQRIVTPCGITIPLDLMSRTGVFETSTSN